MVRMWSSQGAQQDRGERAHQRHDQFVRRRRAEQAGEELAEEGEARDADGERQQPEQRCPARSATADRWSSATVSDRNAQIALLRSVAILGVLVGIAQTRYFQPLLSYIERR